MKKEPQQTYETLMARLVSVVDRLEEGELPLADALALYEEGIALGKSCEKHLDQAALRVEALTTGPDGVKLQPWNDA